MSRRQESPPSLLTKLGRLTGFSADPKANLERQLYEENLSKSRNPGSDLQWRINNYEQWLNERPKEAASKSIKIIFSYAGRMLQQADQCMQNITGINKHEALARFETAINKSLPRILSQLTISLASFKTEV